MEDSQVAVDIALDDDELLCLRLTLELYGDEQCPFPKIEPPADPARIETGTRSLIRRDLLERKGYRPDRDLTRRLLVVSEPDARVVLLAAGPGSAERLVDAYERTGVYVHHTRPTDRHRLGPVLEAIDLFHDLARRFTPRRSTGDFIDLTLDAAEHFAFSSFAQELTLDARRSTVLSGSAPQGPVDGTLDGAILLPGKQKRFVKSRSDTVGRPPIPDEQQWQAALTSLVAKDVLRVVDGGYQLKPYLFDLAVGLVRKTRYVLTRFDFSEDDWVVRDATLVPVKGSLFAIRATEASGLVIRELDARGLEQALHEVVDPLE